MQSASENRFDPSFAAQVLVEIGHEQSLEKLLQKLIERVMERPYIACSQVWLIEKGDVCATCPFRSECPDQARCLHLVAGRAKSILDNGRGLGQFQMLKVRVPLGLPPLGSAVATANRAFSRDTMWMMRSTTGRRKGMN